MDERTKAQKATGSIRNQALDTMKLILSVFVVLIHAEVDIGILQPFLRTAVPLFFITSAWFFFRKTESCGSSEARRSVLARFLKRNMMLYGFWFVVLLPITLYVRKWFSGTIAQGILGFLQSFLFNSTFRASWYIMALNIGMCIALWLSLRLSPGVQVLVTLPVYLLCCLFTNYYGIAARSEGIMAVYGAYIAAFRSLSNSFPVALLWLSLGRWFANNRLPLSRPWLYAAAAISGIALAAEYLLVSRFGLQKGDDAYLMLVPLCSAIFCLVKDSPSPWTGIRRSGHISTIVYASHASVITVVGAVVRRVLGEGFTGMNWIIFALSMTVCALGCGMIFRLEKHRRFRWLRFAY